MDNQSCCGEPVAMQPMPEAIIRYLNTDLDLRSAEDLTTLAAVFRSCGMWQNHLIQEEDGNWFAIFETGDCCTDPNQTITRLLDVVESLAQEYKTIWSRCTKKEFNIGYQCGTTPQSFTQEVSSEVVARMAAWGASFCVTLYPDDAQRAKPVSESNVIS